VESFLSRITTNPRQCDGRPCILSMRIRAADVLQLFATDLPAALELLAAGKPLIEIGNTLP